MRSIAEQIAALEKELENCPGGYISRKVISGKERFYLQWTEDGKVKSKYIKADELSKVRASVDRRHAIQEKLKELKATPEGIKTDNLKRKAVRNMQNMFVFFLFGSLVLIEKTPRVQHHPPICRKYLFCIAF